MSLPLPGKFRFLGNFQDRGQEVSQAHCLGVSLNVTGGLKLGVKPTRSPDNLAKVGFFG